MGPLSSVIYNIARDSIQCRACRLVGNLAKEPYIAEQLHIERIADSIVSLLVSGSGCSTATQQMAVRALRLVYYNVCNSACVYFVICYVPASLLIVYTAAPGHLILLSQKHRTEQTLVYHMKDVAVFASLCTVVSCLVWASTLMMEATYSSRTLLDFQKTRWSYIQEGRALLFEDCMVMILRAVFRQKNALLVPLRHGCC